MSDPNDDPLVCRLDRIATALETLARPRGDIVQVGMEKERAELAIKSLAFYMFNTASGIAEFLDDPTKNMMQRAQFFREVSKDLVEFAKRFMPPMPVDYPHGKTAFEQVQARFGETVQEPDAQASPQGGSQPESSGRAYRAQKVWKEADGGNVGKGSETEEALKIEGHPYWDGSD
jgi:cytochrome c556